MSRLRRVARMCSSTLSVNCEKAEKDTEEKILCRSPISKRSHVSNLRQTIQGKGRSSKRKGNRRLSFLFAPAAGTASSPRRAPQSPALRRAQLPAEIQRKTPRPERANTLTQFAHPAGLVQKGSRPLGANTLTQFVCPGQPVLKKLPPRSGEHACGSSSAPLDFTLISYYTERAKYVVTTTKQEEI